MAQIDVETLEIKRAQIMAQLEQVIGQANWLRGQQAMIDDLIALLKNDKREAVTPPKTAEEPNHG